MSGKESPRIRLLRMLCDEGQRQEFRQASLTVADIMSSPPITVDSSRLLSDIIGLFSTHSVRHVLITRRSELVGIISDRDVLKALWKGHEDLRQPLIDIATRNPKVVSPDTSIEEVASLMLAGHFSAIPVVDGEKELLGIITSTDLVWLIKLIQIANNKNPQRMLRSLVAEIERLATAEELTLGEGEELTLLVGDGSPPGAPSSPSAS